jgi:hypothetical protein
MQARIPRKNKPNLVFAPFSSWRQAHMLLVLLIKTSVFQKEFDLYRTSYYNLPAFQISLPRMGFTILY